MAATAEELIVALRSEGAQQAQEDLEGVEEKTGEVSSELGSSAAQMEEFQGAFRGAMGALLAGAAIAIGGLASQVPIVGELMGGLAAILEAVGLQVDQLARDLGAGGLTGVFFDVAAAINEQEGVFGDLVGVFGTITAAVGGAVAGYLGYIAATQGVIAAGGTLVSGLGTVISILGSVAAAIISLPGAIAVAIAGIVAFTAAYLTNWRGTRDKTNQIVGQIVDFVVGGFNTLATRALAFIDSLTTQAVSKFNTLRDDLTNWASDLATQAIQWGTNLIGSFIQGIRQKLGQLKNIIDNISSGNFNINLDGGSAGESSGGAGRQTAIPSGNTGGTNISLDGRRLDEQQGRYGRSNTARRGI